VLKHRIAQKHVENDSLIEQSLRKDRERDFFIEALQTSLNKAEYSALLSSMTLKRNHLVKLYNAGQRTPKRAAAAAAGGGGGGGGGGGWDVHDALKALLRKQVEESITRAKASGDAQRLHTASKDRVERLRLKRAQKQAQGPSHEQGLPVPEENVLAYLRSLTEAQRLEALSIPAERLQAEVGRLLERASHVHGLDFRGVSSAMACWVAALRGDHPEGSFVARSLSGGFRVYASVPMFNAVMHYCPLWRFYARVFSPDDAPGADGLAPWARAQYSTGEEVHGAAAAALEGMRRYALQWAKGCKPSVRELVRQRLLQSLDCRGGAGAAAAAGGGEAPDVERLVGLCGDAGALEGVCLALYRGQVCERVAELETRLLESSPLLHEMERSLGAAASSVREARQAKGLLLSSIADDDEVSLRDLLRAERVAEMFDWIPELLAGFRRASRPDCGGGSLPSSREGDGGPAFESPPAHATVVMSADGVPRVWSQRPPAEGQADPDGPERPGPARGNYLTYRREEGLLDFSSLVPPGCSVEELWRTISSDPFTAVDNGHSGGGGASGGETLGGRPFEELCFLFANLELQYREKFFKFTMDVLHKGLVYAKIHQTLGKLEGAAKAAAEVRGDVDFEIAQGVSGVRREWLQCAHRLLECLLHYAHTLTLASFELQHEFLRKKCCEGFEMDFEHAAGKGQELQEVVQQIRAEAKQLKAALHCVASARRCFAAAPRRHPLDPPAAAGADGLVDAGGEAAAAAARADETPQLQKKAELAAGVKLLQEAVSECAQAWRAHLDAHVELRLEVLSYLRDRDDERLNAFCGCNRLSVDMVKYLSLALIREEFLCRARTAADEERRLLEVRAQAAREQLERDLAEQRVIASIVRPVPGRAP
jgi:hypothetical protein